MPHIPGLSLAIERLPTWPPETLYATLCAAFPDDASRDYVQRLTVGANAHARLAALALLPPLLRNAGYAPEDFSLCRDAAGRPFLRPHDPALVAPDLNLSHSAARAVCALWCGGGRVGVDVEEPIPADRAARLAARFCSPGERRIVAAAGDPAALSAAFTRIWTRKEALCKQDGGGQPLRFDSELPPPGVRLFSCTLPDTGAALSICVPVSP